jgi:hypothetical protein
VEANVCRIFIVYWGSNNQEKKGWSPINWLSPAALSLWSQARTWISISTYQFNDLRGVVVPFVIGGIIDHHCLKHYIHVCPEPQRSIC